MDDDAFWCSACPIIHQVEPSAIEQTCTECRASDQNKDAPFEDPYFRRIWLAAQLKIAGVPVLDLSSSLDDVLAIQAVENQMREIAHDNAVQEARNKQDTEV